MKGIVGHKGKLAQINAGQLKKYKDTHIGLAVIKHYGEIWFSEKGEIYIQSLIYKVSVYLRNLSRVLEMSRCEPFSIMLMQDVMKSCLSSHWYMHIRLQLYYIISSSWICQWITHIWILYASMR